MLANKISQFKKAEAKFKSEAESIKKREAHAVIIKIMGDKKEKEIEVLLKKAKKIAAGLEEAEEKKKGFKVLKKQIPKAEMQLEKIKGKAAAPAAVEAAIEKEEAPAEEEKEKHEEVPISELRHGNINTMIEEARAAIKNSELARAKMIIAAIEKSYSKIKKEDEKRVISYDIRELKTNLKLASLA